MLDFTKLKTITIKKRTSKVDKSLFGKPIKAGASFDSFYRALPNILKVKELNEVVAAIIKARKKRKPVIFMMGAHVVKCGLAPIVIDLIDHDIVTAVATNGAGIIHDFEVAYWGATSEDVSKSLLDGSFGMVRETADFINGALHEGVRAGCGYGESIGFRMERSRLKNKNLSIALACRKKNIPLTVHVGIGTDINHQHANFSGADTGEASARDFKKLAENVAGLNNGGVLLNFGSAVMMPEVFLKALSMARNLTGRVNHFTTANFDMNFHYRPQQNIVSRPTMAGGRGVYIVGHHEIMLPLLAAAVLQGMEKKGDGHDQRRGA